MKKLIYLSLLASISTALFACPPLNGPYQCQDENKVESYRMLITQDSKEVTVKAEEAFDRIALGQSSTSADGFTVTNECVGDSLITKATSAEMGVVITKTYALTRKNSKDGKEVTITGSVKSPMMNEVVPTTVCQESQR